ncbi:MAG: FGGY family carbohydrate kinase [Eubacteriales bacterium]|nr:FGGY family carbohydrate kinase [Eubacteriales bacterium]
MQYLLGCDFGGGASKATLLREDGAVVATATTEYPTHYPKNGWAEQDPEDSYRALLRNIREILRVSGISPADIAALALDGATHPAVLLDENDRVIRPAIYWTDRRSAQQAQQLQANHGEEIFRLSYNAPGALWTLPQLMWLKEFEPEHHRRIRKVLSMKDYVRYRLTGDFVTDAIEAMGFMLLDATKNEWSDFLLGLAGLRMNVMPEIVDPAQVLSPMTPAALRDTGLSASTKVIAGSTDTVMEVYASGAIRPGQATVKLATAGRICPITDHAVVSKLLVCYRHVVPGMWYPGTATKSCAASNRWYRDVLCGAEVLEAQRRNTDPYVLMSADAATVPAGCDGLMFHPYLQGEITPYCDDMLRGSFTGISAAHTKAHFNRAVLEGVAYSMKDCYEVLKTLGIAPDTATVIGGGAKSPLWRQILADMLGIPLSTVENVDSSLGSAMLAGVAAGVFDSFRHSVEKCVRPKEIVRPNPATQALYETRFGFYKRIHDALAPIYHDGED